MPPGTLFFGLSSQFLQIPRVLRSIDTTSIKQVLASRPGEPTADENPIVVVQCHITHLFVRAEGIAGAVLVRLFS